MASKKAYSKAIDDYSEVIRLDPKHIGARYGRAVAWYEKKDYDRAVQDYSEVIILDPKNVGALMTRGSIWYRQGYMNKAIEDFSKVIRLDPQNGLVLYMRGLCWHTKAADAKKGYEQALKDYDEAIRLDPKRVRGLLEKAIILATCSDDKLRDVDKAEAFSKTLVALKPTDPETEELLGVIAAARGRFEEAVKHQKKALEDKQYEAIRGDQASRRLKTYEAKQPLRE